MKEETMPQYKTQEEADAAFLLSYAIVKQMSFLKQMEKRILRVEAIHAEVAETQRLVKESIDNLIQ